MASINPNFSSVRIDRASPGNSISNLISTMNSIQNNNLNKIKLSEMIRNNKEQIKNNKLDREMRLSKYNFDKNIALEELKLRKEKYNDEKNKKIREIALKKQNKLDTLKSLISTPDINIPLTTSIELTKNHIADVINNSDEKKMMDEIKSKGLDKQSKKPINDIKFTPEELKLKKDYENIKKIKDKSKLFKAKIKFLKNHGGFNEDDLDNGVAALTKNIFSFYDNIRLGLNKYNPAMLIQKNFIDNEIELEKIRKKEIENQKRHDEKFKINTIDSIINDRIKGLNYKLQKQREYEKEKNIFNQNEKDRINKINNIAKKYFKKKNFKETFIKNNVLINRSTFEKNLNEKIKAAENVIMNNDKLNTDSKIFAIKNILNRAKAQREAYSTIKEYNSKLSEKILDKKLDTESKIKIEKAKSGFRVLEKEANKNPELDESKIKLNNSKTSLNLAKKKQIEFKLKK